MPNIFSAAATRSAARPRFRTAFAALALALTMAAGAQQSSPTHHPSDKDPSQGTPVLMDAMTAELHRAFTSLGKQAPGKQEADKQLPPYFLSYAVSDASAVSIRAQFGALVDSSANHVRVADVQVRIGSAKLDNTHGSHRSSAVNSMAPSVPAPEVLTSSLRATGRRKTPVLLGGL